MEEAEVRAGMDPPRHMKEASRQRRSSRQAKKREAKQLGEAQGADTGPVVGNTSWGEMKMDAERSHEVVLMAGKPGSKIVPQRDPGSMRIPAVETLHVLVVDPCPDSRAKTVELLEETGYQVLNFSSGNHALNFLTRERVENGVNVDVILKAHCPPKSSAIDFLAGLRKIQKIKDILVIGTSYLMCCGT